MSCKASLAALQLYGYFCDFFVLCYYRRINIDDDDDPTQPYKLSKYAELASDYLSANCDVLSTHLRQAFYLILLTKFVHHLRARTQKLHSFSSISLFLFNVSILCFCTTLSPKTAGPILRIFFVNNTHSWRLQERVLIMGALWGQGAKLSVGARY